MAQHDDLDGEIGVTSANESDELEGAAERQVEEREGHCWMLVALGSSHQSAGRRPWMTFSAPTGRSLLVVLVRGERDGQVPLRQGG